MAHSAAGASAFAGVGMYPPRLFESRHRVRHAPPLPRGAFPVARCSARGPGRALPSSPPTGQATGALGYASRAKRPPDARHRVAAGCGASVALLA